MRRLLAASLAASLAVLASAQTPQQQTPTFEVGIEVINLNVSVTDGRGRYVTDLTEKDFAVYEDGVKQDLTLFTHENLPISLALLIDGSASMDEKMPTAQAAATRFVKTLRPQDLAQIVLFNDRAQVLQEYTADQALLESAIKRTVAAGPTALHNALYVTLKELQKQKKAGELRRRAVVLLSDGEDTASLVTDDQVLELARKTEINIYAISLRPNRPSDRDRQSFSQAAHLLTALTRETGGQVHFPTSLSELDAVYDRIAEELRTQYNLGYVSANSRKDGKWRRIVVRVPERDDLQVRHKLGYFAAPS
jgi:VWFA-related protein